jgi:hypothetical protein
MDEGAPQLHSQRMKLKTINPKRVESAEIKYALRTMYASDVKISTVLFFSVPDLKDRLPRELIHRTSRLRLHPKVKVNHQFSRATITRT